MARTVNLTELYPKFNSYRGVPQYGPIQGESRKYDWYFDTNQWFGGVEFTLRRKEYVPSLQILCRELLPKEDHVVNEDGSLGLDTKIASEKDDVSPVNEKAEGDVLITTLYW